MNRCSTLRRLLRDSLRVDRSQILIPNALRNTVGVVAPLAIGAASGRLLVGLTVAIGAMNVVAADRPAPYPLVAQRMLLAGCWGAVSVFVGRATGEISWLAVALATLWGFGGGLLVAVSPAAAQIGTTGIMLLVIFGAQPASPRGALETAGLVLLGAVAQTALSVAAWPVRRYGPQRDALAEVFRQLAAATRTAVDPGQAPFATGAISTARAALVTSSSDHSAEREALRSLLDEAERLRLELLALADMRHRLGTGEDGAGLAARVSTALTAAGDVLAELAPAIASGQRPGVVAVPLQHVEETARTLRQPDSRSGRGDLGPSLAAALRHVNALGGQLRSVLEIATQGSAQGEEVARGEGGRARPIRLRQPLATLRATLTLRSAACRHALRLAACLCIATALARDIDVSRTYWLPMTVALILKPDFAATFRLSVVRAAATLLGLLVATGLAITIFTELPARIAFAGVLMFLMRALGPANYGLLVIPLTALVVILTSFAGAHPEATILERGIFTAAGAALALLIYLAWPTWERTQAPAILADLLDAYRRYFLLVMDGYLAPWRQDRAALDEARQAARLARSNAEASVDRLRGEPVRPANLDRLVGLLAASHRFARGAMALDAGHDEEPSPPDREELRRFVRDVDATMQALSCVLRDPADRPRDLPDLRADQRALAEAASGTRVADSAGDYRLAAIANEADHLTDSVNTMTQVLAASSST